MLFWGLLGAVIVELALLLLLLLLPAREEPAKRERDESTPGREDLLTALGRYSAGEPAVEKAPHPERRERAELVAVPLSPSALQQLESLQETDPEPTTRVTAVPAPARLEPERKLLPRPRPAKPAVQPDPQTAVAESCEIKLWRGYVKCQLYAALLDRAGAATGFAVSPAFRLRDEDTPTEQAAGALKTLIDYLEGEGWTVVSAGARWYQLRLARHREAPWPTTRGSTHG
jgi:outer membrane biosynthesis protein TonB